jgi:hypothetical protein
MRHPSAVVSPYDADSSRQLLLATDRGEATQAWRYATARSSYRPFTKADTVDRCQFRPLCVR